MKEKLKKFFSENKWLVITFVLSSLVISIIYTLQKIAPFGNNSMLDVDFYHQYGPLLNELLDRIKSGESLLYSFNTGGGIPFYRNFLNYLSSPFNIILLLFKKENIVMVFSIIIALKAVFASTTMAFYLKKTFNKNGFMLCVFGLLYAFSGYFCAYYWNIMWLDGMAFLPLIAYGINKIVDNNKPFMYIISLAIMLFANYFIGYMVCIFSVFYFLGYFWYRHGFNFKKLFKIGFCFAVSSVLAGGLVSFALIPLYESLASISATTGVFPTSTVSFNMLDFFFNHLTGVSRTVFASDVLPLPNVYAGLITIVLIISIFLNKKINWRFKLITILFFIVFISSFAITSLDFIWHAFHVPNDLPWRYSFIYVFVIISLAYYASTKIKHLSSLKTSLIFGFLIIFVLLASKTGFANMTDNKIITCLILLISYFVIYLLGMIKGVPKKILKFSFLVLIIGECVYGINVNWNIDHDIKNFMSNKKPYQELIDKARKDDNGLYRIEKTDYLTLNDGAWYDYYGISTFSSMAYENVAKFQRKIGMSGNDINSYYYRQYQTPIYNTMFNIKYIMGNYIENDYYVPLDSSDTYNLMGYNYSSSIGYAVNKDIKNWNLLSYLPFLNQENFVKLSTDVSDVFVPLQVKELIGGKIITNDFLKNSNGEFNYTLDEPGKVLTLEFDNPVNRNVYFYIGGNKVSSFSVNDTYYSLTSDEYYIFDAGRCPEGKLTVKITFDDSSEGDLRFYAYAIDDNAFKKFYDEINDGVLNVSKYNETYVEGKMAAKENQIAFSTIAYDEGWKVYVDGNETKTYIIGDAYLGFDVKSGNHTIKMIYYPKGMKLGIAVSFVSLIILMVYAFIFNKTKHENN